MKDTKDIIGVWCEMSEYPACVMITFDEVSGTAPTPRRFMVKVSKYYPHDRPLVVCMDAGYQNVSLGAGGEVRHTYLQEGWTAMGSLRSIITLLAAMRASDMFAKPPERVAEGPTMSPSWRKYGSHGNGNGNGSGVTDTEMQFSSPVSAVASSCAMEDL